MTRNSFLICSFFISSLSVSAQRLPYLDTSLPVDARVENLISRMTLEEKISQMTHTSKGIPRLGIPDYNWWNECLHGLARSTERVTVFPQPMGVAGLLIRRNGIRLLL